MKKNRIDLAKTKIFRETEIRPAQFDKERDLAYAADLRWLLRRRSKFVDIKCPACNSSRYNIAWHKNKLRYLECKKCETVYISPRPTPRILRDFYQNSAGYEFWNKYIFPTSESARRKHIFKPRVQKLIELCKRFKTKRNLFVEVGSGYGTFAEEVAKTKFFKKVIAIEPSPELAETCRNKGLNVIEKPVEEVELIKKADVVASFEVIEHLFSPGEFISNCSRILSTNGFLMVTCPSIKGFDNATLGPLASAVDHEHLNYFHPDSLAFLFSRHGFDVVEKLTPGKLDAELVRKEILKGNFSTENYPFIKQILIDRWDEIGKNFQKFLADNNLSSHLWIVGKKIV